MYKIICLKMLKMTNILKCIDDFTFLCYFCCRFSAKPNSMKMIQEGEVRI